MKKKVFLIAFALAFVFTVAFSQTTPTLTLVNVNAAAKLYKAEALPEVIQSVGVWYYQQTGNKDRALNITTCIYFAADLSSQNRDRLKEFWDSWSQANEWPYPYGNTVTVTAQERTAVINRLNNTMDAKIDQLIAEWQNVKQ